jgi:hypothetical protein
VSISLARCEWRVRVPNRRLQIVRDKIRIRDDQRARARELVPFATASMDEDGRTIDAGPARVLRLAIDRGLDVLAREAAEGLELE